ncbi:hypothetical protein LTR17_021950 [Elasticomyces elasticus]|nr:hypothetical protein LTR17_021950 [Elasticomyces elasticus]
MPQTTLESLRLRAKHIVASRTVADSDTSTGYGGGGKATKGVEYDEAYADELDNQSDGGSVPCESEYPSRSAVEVDPTVTQITSTFAHLLGGGIAAEDSTPSETEASPGTSGEHLGGAEYASATPIGGDGTITASGNENRNGEDLEMCDAESGAATAVDDDDAVDETCGGDSKILGFEGWEGVIEFKDIHEALEHFKSLVQWVREEVHLFGGLKQQYTTPFLHLLQTIINLCSRAASCELNRIFFACDEIEDIDVKIKEKYISMDLTTLMATTFAFMQKVAGTMQMMLVHGAPSCCTIPIDWDDEFGAVFDIMYYITDASNKELVHYAKSKVITTASHEIFFDCDGGQRCLHVFGEPAETIWHMMHQISPY